MNSESLKLRGTLRGHNGWVTQIATNPKYPDMILSASRGKNFPPVLDLTFSCKMFCMFFFYIEFVNYYCRI